MGLCQSKGVGDGFCINLHFMKMSLNVLWNMREKKKIWNQGGKGGTAEIANSKDFFFSMFIIILLRIRLGLFYE